MTRNYSKIGQAGDSLANRLFDKTMVKALVFISIGVLAVFLVAFAGKYHKTHVGVPSKPKTFEGE